MSRVGRLVWRVGLGRRVPAGWGKVEAGSGGAGEVFPHPKRLAVHGMQSFWPNHERFGVGKRPTPWLWGMVAAATAVLGLGLQAKGLEGVFSLDKLREIDATIESAIAARQCPGGVLWLEREGQA